MAKIETIQTLTVKRNASNGGPIYANTWNDIIEEVLHDLNEFSDQWNNNLTPLTDTLPDGTLDATVNAFSDGLSGKTIFSSASATSTSETLYWNSGSARPKTLFEQFADIYNTIDNVKDTLEGQIAIQIPSAIQVGIADNGNLYTSSNVEDALAEVKAAVNLLSSSAAGVEIEEEGSSIGTGFTRLNFVGASVTASDAGSNEATITLTDVASGVSGSVQFSDGSALSSDSATFFWDNSTKRLGIGTNTPSSTMHAYHNTFAGLTLQTTNFPNMCNLILQNATRTWIVRNDGSESDKFKIYDSTATSTRFTIDSSGKIGMGTTTPNEKLTVSGVLSLAEVAAPSLTAGHGKLYAGTDSELHFIDDAGNDVQITSLGSVNAGGGSGDVTKVGTPANNQIGVWTGDGTLEGDSDLTWNTDTFTITVNSTNDLLNTLNINQTNTGDAKIGFQLSGGTHWFVGLDNSDSDKFKISNSFNNNGFTMDFTTLNVGIGTNAPNAVAVLDLSSTTKGFLPPRMTTTQRNAISTPPAGLTIFNTTTTKLETWDGSTWQPHW